MKVPLAVAGLLAALGTSALVAQSAPGLGEVLVSAQRSNIPYTNNEQPVVGLKRRADAMVLTFQVESDTREAATRTQEIHTVLAGLIDRAKAAGLELVTGRAQLVPITKLNYKSLEMVGAGRVDTSRVWLMVKAPLGASADATQLRLNDFIRAAKGMGRATVESSGSFSLTVVDPDQYRDQIISLVAADASHSAALFGPGFSYTITGVDGQVSWWQVSPSEVFLTLPYRYVIIPR